jgi:CheY-like chemotaxis protein
MEILIAEDDKDTTSSYKKALEERNHKVIITDNGEECLRVYHEKLQGIRHKTNATEHIQPFDAVILDYKMPRINGMEVSKEILAVNPHQRIIFASAYVKETLEGSIKQLSQDVELMQKPFGPNALIDAVEDKEIYDELRQLNVNIHFFKAANFRHEQLKNILETLRKLQKARSF